MTIPTPIPGRLARLAFAVVALVVLPATASGALIKLDLEKLTQRSQRIVCGEVTALLSRWVEIPKLGRVIVTDVTIRVSESWKGAPGKEITVKYFGGEVGDDSMLCIESPRYALGEKVLVFARNGRLGGLWTTGWVQGKFKLEESASGTIVDGKSYLPLTARQPLATVRESVQKINVKYSSSAAPDATGSATPGSGTPGSGTPGSGTPGSGASDPGGEKRK